MATCNYIPQIMFNNVLIFINQTVKVRLYWFREMQWEGLKTLNLVVKF